MSDPLLDPPSQVRKPRPRFGYLASAKKPIGSGMRVRYVGENAITRVDLSQPDAGEVVDGPSTAGTLGISKINPGVSQDLVFWDVVWENRTSKWDHCWTAENSLEAFDGTP